MLCLRKRNNSIVRLLPFCSGKPINMFKPKPLCFARGSATTAQQAQQLSYPKSWTCGLFQPDSTPPLMFTASYRQVGIVACGIFSKQKCAIPSHIASNIFCFYLSFDLSFHGIIVFTTLMFVGMIQIGCWLEKNQPENLIFYENILQRHKHF